MSETLRHAEETLAHYGVLGMKWGKRKAHLNSTNYGSRDRLRDQQQYGLRGTKRIEGHVQAGTSIKKARRKEFRRQTAQGAAFIATAGVVLLGPGLAKTGAASLVNKRQLKAEDWANLQKLIDKNALTAYKTIVL